MGRRTTAHLAILVRDSGAQALRRRTLLGWKRLGSARALPSVHFAETIILTGWPNTVPLKRYTEDSVQERAIDFCFYV
jgi:hypothetical protein